MARGRRNEMSGVIFLVRHGETEWNLTRRYQGWSDSPLTRRGVAQAEAFGRRLRALSEAEGVAVVSSPLGRARRTAELIQAQRADPAPIVFDERLKEISIGAWDELDRAEIEALSPGIFAGDGRDEWYFRTPDGETYDQFAGRIAAWLDEIAGRALIVVAHGVVTRVLRGLYAGLPRAAALSLPVPQDVIWRLADGRIEEIAI
ncbi:MAG TPA: histidine phosphatase family protein [Stellaceae bacterium]|nr:histidine phosphatase family protein [Stellaceae bacterium]